MKLRIILTLVFLSLHTNAYAWDSDNATTSVFQLFYFFIGILFLVAFKWAGSSTFVRILVIALSIGFLLLLLMLAVMFAPDGHPTFYKAVGGFVLLIGFAFFYRKRP